MSTDEGRPQRLGARMRVRVTPADVGERVSLRARAGDGFVDALGWLRSWQEGVVEVERADGRRTRLAETDLVAGKVVGPPPARTR